MLKRHFLILFLCTLCVACSPRIANRGHVDMQQNMAKIVPGKAYKQDVLKLLGSPSAQSSFGDETWYYITARKETTAFFKPELTKQETTRIMFDSNGRVTEVKQYGLNDGENIALVDKVTPTEGQELGLWEQLLGNFGRFNKPTRGPSTTSGINER